MSLRRSAATMAAAAAIACAVPLSLVALGGVAGAANPLQVATVNPVGSVAAGTPFQSGQTVSVVVPPNADLPANIGVQIVECAAPNGVLPTQASQCDTATAQGPTVIPNADGSINFTSYPIYALPDAFSLGETPSSTPVCGNTVANECVLLVTNDYTNPTAPHVFTQPFLIVPSANDLAPSPGDGTPEAPLAIGLPLGAAGIVGGAVLYRRRSKTRAA